MFSNYFIKFQVFGGNTGLMEAGMDMYIDANRAFDPTSMDMKQTVKQQSKVAKTFAKVIKDTYLCIYAISLLIKWYWDIEQAHSWLCKFLYQERRFIDTIEFEESGGITGCIMSAKCLMSRKKLYEKSIQ